MAWDRRTTAPDVSIKYYRHTGYFVDGVEGVNECIIIDQQTGFVMPNCVGYSWGRWYEALRQRPNLSRGDAQYWYGYTQDGYSRGVVPRPGAIACYSGGSIGGHVAVVEYLVGGTVAVTSNSAYNSTLFWMEGLVFNPDTGAWDRPVSGYNFQGFIYPPEGSGGAFKPWLFNQRRFPNGMQRLLNQRRC